MTILSLVPVKYSIELPQRLHQPVGDTTLGIAVPTTLGIFPMRVTPMLGCRRLLLINARQWTHCPIIYSACFSRRSMPPILPSPLEEKKPFLLRSKQPVHAHSLSIYRD
jgi:hypothetical protein